MVIDRLWRDNVLRRMNNALNRDGPTGYILSLQAPNTERRTAGSPFKFRDSSNWNAWTTMVDFTIMLSCWHANWTKLDLTLFNATRQFKEKKRKLRKNCQIIYNTLSLKKKTRNKIFIQQSFKSCSRVQSLQKKKKPSSVIAPIESKC